MTDPNPTYDASPCHHETVPIGALSAKSHALQEALAENERLRAWARAWKQLCKQLYKQANESQASMLRLITKENPRSAEVAYTGLMLMAAFANDQGDDESVEECAFRVVRERDELRRLLDEVVDSDETLVGAEGSDA